MNFFRALIALVLVASLTGNLYLAWKVWENGGKPEFRTMTTDEAIVMRTSGGLLEVAIIKSPERFEAAQNHTILGVDVGKTVSRIRVPAVFRYHIELAPEWKILLRDKAFIVVAPAVRPSLPVAIDTANMEKESSGIWSIFTGTALVEELQRSITAALATKASSDTYVQFQREAARKTVTEFVAKWLVTQEQWKSASSYPIRVFFADEPIQVLGTTPLPLVGALLK
jgi:hypothetical protein